MADSPEALLTQFDKQRPAFEAMNIKVKALIEELLADRGIRVQSISGRVKTRDSFERKVELAEIPYASLSQITDISGIRIITYYSEDVDKVGQIVCGEFQIDDSNSVDKRLLLEPDQFGYLSLHYVARLSNQRASLREYAKFEGLSTEIQIRTVLQHAWAEIEHDLGYKSAEEVPKPIRRRFSRLASLLEVADEQFCSIRSEIAEHSRRSREQMRTSADSVLIDVDSLRQALKQESPISAFEKRLAASKKAELIPSSHLLLKRFAEQLTKAGFKTLADLNSFIAVNETDAIWLASAWPEKLQELRGGSTSPGGAPRGPSMIASGAMLMYIMLLKAAQGRFRSNFIADASEIGLMSGIGRERLLSECYDLIKRRQASR